MENALISVIVPVYKVEAYLPKCVDSILAQTYQNLEIILVDDGSPDRSGEICEEYARRDSRIRVIHKRNGGLSSARNAGLDVAAGEYVAFVDSDDYLVPDAYEAMLNAARKHQTRLVCAGRYDVEAATGEVTPGLCPEKEEKITGVELVKRIFHWDHLDSAAWDKLYGMELFREIRYPVGKIVEDVPTTYRLALKAGSAVMLPKPIYYYLHRENSITTAAVSEKNFHFSQHALKIYDEISSNLPELEPSARYLMVRSLVYNLLVLEIGGETVKERFPEQYWDSRNRLEKNVGFILRSPLFTKREKLEDFLLAYGLYIPLRKVYHFLRHQKD